MSREITTYPISTEEIWEELLYLAEYFLHRGHESCELLFASAWGNDYYDTNIWYPELVPLAELSEKVKQVETSGIGHLGNNDLFIKIPGLSLEFQFCHHSDIHLFFGDPDETTGHFFARWESRGFTPRERIKKD